MTAYHTGDPVVDLAQGRPMLVVAVPEQTVDEWSEQNNYDLTGNYANSKFDPDPEEGVVETVYLGDIRSEPSKTYTFPVSRVALIDVHHADDGRRIYERVARDVLERLFGEIIEPNEKHEADWVGERLEQAGVDPDLVAEARELADVEQRFGGDTDNVDPSSGGGFET